MKLQNQLGVLGGVQNITENQKNNFLEILENFDLEAQENQKYFYTTNVNCLKFIDVTRRIILV